MTKIGKISFLFAGICVVTFAVTRFLVGAFIPFLWIPIGLFALFVGLAFFYDRKFYLEFLLMRTTRHGMNMLTLIGLTLVLLMTINYMGVRYNKSWDITPNKINSLSEQSKNLIRQLDEELLVRFFYQQGAAESEENKNAFRLLIRKYQDMSDKVKLEFVEINERPDLAESYGIKKGAGIVFLDYKGRRGRVDRIQEQEVTQALMTVVKEKEKVIYFLTGHGERNFEDPKDTQGILQFKQLLEGNRYKVESVNLVTSPKIPEHTDVLAIVGPQQKLLDVEVKVIKDYLSRGGNLLVALKKEQVQNMGDLLATLGLRIEPTYVVTLMDTVFGKAIDPSVTTGVQFSSVHEITKVFVDNQFALFHLPAPLKKLEPTPAGFIVTELVGSGLNSLGYKDTTFKGVADKGPFSLVMAVTGKLGVKEFRAVVASDTSFLGNQLIYQNLNRDLALNTVSYLAKDENMISISPKEPEVTTLVMSPTMFSVLIIFVFIPLPILLLSTGLVFWMRRRNA